MNQIKSICLLVLWAVSFSLHAQMKQADRYYDFYDYPNAIKLYEKVLKKEENNKDALEKIANSYRLTKNYTQAEIYYSRLIRQPDIKPINHFYYGKVLKSNGKLDLAREQFSIYLKSSPDDKPAEESMKSLGDVKLWIKKTNLFEVNPVDNINTKHSEFCPVLFKDKLYFTSDREEDMVNNTNYSWNKQPFLNVCYVDVIGKKDSNLVFSNKVKTKKWSSVFTESHDGPVCFNKEQNLLFITRVIYLEKKKDKDFVNRPKLFYAEAKGDGWGEMKPFQYNDDAYSLAHPSLSADGKWLYFSSDMPGGFGGTDIYVSHKEADGWGKPQNLGDEVNTKGDEVFPYIRKDGKLYFSSDGHAGFGGLDLLEANKVNDKYSEVNNLGAPVNSATDDFGIIFTDDLIRGYFSSDRTSGKGADDIYSFISLHKFISVEGKLLGSQNIDDPLKRARVKLLDETGAVLNEAITDSVGGFKFEELDPEKKYMVKVDEHDPLLADKDKVYMADKTGKIVSVTVINEKGEKFIFKSLALNTDIILPVPIESDDNFAGNLLFGQNPSKPMEGITVNLVNDKGQILQTTKTNSKGAFVFRHLPSDQNYMVKIDDADADLEAGTKIIITNKNGKEVQSTAIGTKGKFNFTFLASDKNVMEQMAAQDAELRFDFNGRLSGGSKAPVAYSRVNIVNEKGDVLETGSTDENGVFHFKHLPTNQDILFSIYETDTKYKEYNKLYLSNEKGNLIKEFSRNEKGQFAFSILPADIKKLGLVYWEDAGVAGLKTTEKTSVEQEKATNKEPIANKEPEKKAGTPKTSPVKNEPVIKTDSETVITITSEIIYYSLADYNLSGEAKTVLDKIINNMKQDSKLVLELSSYTDCRGSVQYNLNLSGQRAAKVKEYLYSAGISKNRISGKGFGETKLMNKCADGVECSEEEHSKNRRTEFKIYLK